MASQLTNTDLTDLQVLSQIAWMDEFFLQDPDIHELVNKGRGYSADDQQLVVKKQREFLAMVLPAYANAAQRGCHRNFHLALLPSHSAPGLRYRLAVFPTPGFHFRRTAFSTRMTLARRSGAALICMRKVFGMRPTRHVAV